MAEQSDGNLQSPEHTAALDAFHPSHFGFEPHGNGWKKNIPRIGDVGIAPLSWKHFQLPVTNAQGNQINALDFITDLQQEVWGMPPIETTPGNLMAVVEATGGTVLATYDIEKGLTPEGWLGFTIAFGGRDGTILLHLIGVREDLRGQADIGWNLMMIQGYEALQRGHTRMQWTYDPMRGANAKLNFEKLGGSVSEYTIDKYGQTQGGLYGNAPSDRFTLEWNITSPPVLERIKAYAAGDYNGLTIEDIAMLPLATENTIAEILESQPEQLAFQIPSDIDGLLATDPEYALSLRRLMRVVLSQLLTTHTAQVSQLNPPDPALVTEGIHTGKYRVDGFASSFNSQGERENYYRLRRG